MNEKANVEESDTWIVTATRRSARVMAMLALILMGAGWMWADLTDLNSTWPGQPAPRPDQLIQPGANLTPEALMGLGLLALTILPALNLLLVLIGRLRARCLSRQVFYGREAGLAAAVLAVLMLSALANR